jgi:membrane-associated phospholipid phosphatase
MPLAGAAACTVALAVLAYAAYSVAPVEHLDVRIYLHFEFEQYPALFPANALVHLGDLGPLLVLTALTVGIGLHFGRRREVVAALAVISGANVSTQLLKVALEHPRHALQAGMPSFWAHLLPAADAFPSGHTTAVASVAVAMLFVVPARHRMAVAAIGIFLTASMAISVVVLGWHYPSDAIGAIFVAAAWGFLMVAALRLSVRPSGAAGRELTAVRRPLGASGD